jgi:hypothetical protein
MQYITKKRRFETDYLFVIFVEDGDVGLDGSVGKEYGSNQWKLVLRQLI